MTAPPAAVARLRPLGLEFTTAWTLGVGLLLAAPQWRYPTRNLAAELSAWSLGLPLLLWAVTIHVRRRQPQLVVAAQRLALVAALLRLTALLCFTAASLRLAPEHLGHTSDDGHIGSMAVRSIILATGGEETSWQYSTLIYGYSLRSLLGSDEDGGPKPVWLWAHGLLCRVVGFSVVTVALPLALLNVFFLVQVGLLLRCLCHPATALLVVAWALLAPDQALVACGLHKDFSTAVGLLYILEYGSRGLVPQPQPRLGRVALVVIWVSAFRSDIWPLPIGLYCWLWLLPRLPRHRQTPAAVVAVLLACAAGAVIGGEAIGQTSADLVWRKLFVVNLAVGLFASPLLYTAAFGIHRNPFLYTMCDLPIALIWPLVSGLLAVGLLLAWRRRPPLGSGALWVMFGWQLTIAASGYGLLHRFRLPLDPLLLAFAIETARQIGQDPSARRAPLLRFALTIATLIGLIQVAPLLFKIADYPVLP